MSKHTEILADQQVAASPAKAYSISYDFTVRRFSDNVIRTIFWITFAFFVFSVPTQWLTSWFGLEFGYQVAEWMYKTFSVDPGRVLTEPWLLITHMLMHGGIFHFGMNMLILYTFYRSAREFFPSKTWLIVYFGSGVAGALLYALMNNPGSLMVGASGGVMGLWGAAIAARIRYSFVPADERPWQCSLTLKSLLIFLALQAGTEFLIPNVAHSAHAGGMLAGLCMGFLLPMWQQPRLVASRAGLFQVGAEVVKSHLGKMISQIKLAPLDLFDRENDFLAVEYDRIDWRNRRSVWYETLLGTMPENITDDRLVFVASARQIGSETPAQFGRRIQEESGQPVPAEDQKTKKITSHSVTVMFVAYLLLGQLTLSSQFLPYIAAVAALLTTAMWYLIIKNLMIRDLLSPVRRPYCLAAFVIVLAAIVLGGGFACARMFDQTEVAVRLLVSLAAGHTIQRFIIAPLMLRSLNATKPGA